MNSPRLRFKEFNSDWITESLQDITSSFRSGEGITSERITSQGSHPVYGGNGLRGFTDKYTHDGCYALIGRQGALCGNIKVVEGKNYISEHAIAVKGNDKADTKWLGLKLDLMKLNRLSESSAQPGLAVNKLLKLKVAIPPTIEEQKKIAAFISSIDKKISLLIQKHELLTANKKGVMQKIFTQEIKFRDDVGNHYAGWQFLRLGDLSDVRDGTHDSPKYQPAGKPLVTSKNLLKNGTLDLDNTNYISEVDFININKRSKVDVGDILFGMIGTIGNPVMVKTCNFAIKNVALIKEINLLKNSFLSYYLSSSSIQKQISIANAGNSQKFISLGNVRNLEVALPVIAEQLKIVSFLTALDEKIAIVKKQLDLTSQYRHGLLQQMFI
jgi:type I restriction enzyme S subunit